MQTVRLAKKELTEKDLTRIDFASIPLEFDKEFAKARRQFQREHKVKIKKPVDKILFTLGLKTLVGINQVAEGVN